PTLSKSTCTRCSTSSVSGAAGNSLLRCSAAHIGDRADAPAAPGHGRFRRGRLGSDGVESRRSPALAFPEEGCGRVSHTTQSCPSHWAGGRSWSACLEATSRFSVHDLTLLNLGPPSGRR